MKTEKLVRRKQFYNEMQKDKIGKDEALYDSQRVVQIVYDMSVNVSEEYSNMQTFEGWEIKLQNQLNCFYG